MFADAESARAAPVGGCEWRACQHASPPHRCSPLARRPLRRIALASPEGVGGVPRGGWAGDGSGRGGAGGARLDAPGLGQVDPLVGEGDLELAVAREHERDPDRERAPLAGLALQVDVAAQQLGQLADDRQAQPGPLVLAGQDVVALAGQPWPGGTSRRSSRGLPRRCRCRCPGPRRRRTGPRRGRAG